MSGVSLGQPIDSSSSSSSNNNNKRMNEVQARFNECAGGEIDKDATEPANEFALFCVGTIWSVASMEEHRPEVYENRMMVFNILINDILLWYTNRKKKFRPSATINSYLVSVYLIPVFVKLRFQLCEIYIYIYIYIYTHTHTHTHIHTTRGSVLAFSTQVCGFKPGRSRRIFRAKKSSARLPSEGK